MKINIFITVLLGISFLYSCQGFAQNRPDSDFPTPGKPCPELTLHNIEFGPVKEGTPEQLRSNFKGKWLILDFWDKACTSCIATFPEVKQWQEKYESQIKWILIGNQDKQGEIRPLYEKYRKKFGLKFTCAFDSLIFDRLEITGVPHVVVVDPNGIVRGVTNFLEESNITDFLAGREPKLAVSYLRKGLSTAAQERFYTFDEKVPYLSSGNGGIEPLRITRAVVSKTDGASYRDLKGRKSIFVISQWNLLLDGYYNQLACLNWSLHNLYSIAYTGGGISGSLMPRIGGPNIKNPEEEYLSSLYGSFNNVKIFYEVRDSSIFNWNGRFDDTAHLFCFSAQLPKSFKRSQYQQAMISALDQAFNLKSTIEIRKMPCWRLISLSDEAKTSHVTKGGDWQTAFGSEKFSGTNCTIDCLIYWLLGTKSENFSEGWPIINETGIKGNIDLELEGSYLDWNERLTNLRAKGFDLIKGYKDMQVIVIRDAGPADTKLPVPLN